MKYLIGEFSGPGRELVAVVMFILKRQDVEISSVVHPKREQKVPVLYYQGQTFRLISVFKASQEEEAKALWRDLTDNRGKACVLLEEVDRFSVWGKIRLDNLEQEEAQEASPILLIQAAIALLQSVFIEVEELLGGRQATKFEKDLVEVCRQRQYPQTSTPDAIKYLLQVNPFQGHQLPRWNQQNVISFLGELHRLGKAYFGNTNFARPVADKLIDMPESDRSIFITWLSQSPLDKLWS